MVTVEERRKLIAMMCKVAWADGVVTDEERTAVKQLVMRLGSPVSLAEAETWLDEGGPEVTAAALPGALGEMAIYEAMQVMEADGDVDERELALVQSLMNRTR